MATKPTLAGDHFATYGHRTATIALALAEDLAANRRDPERLEAAAMRHALVAHANALHLAIALLDDLGTPPLYGIDLALATVAELLADYPERTP